MQSWWSRSVAGARAVFVHMTQYTKHVLGRLIQKKGKKIHTDIHTPPCHTHTPPLYTHIYCSQEATHSQWWISRTQTNCLGIQLKCSVLLKTWYVWTGCHSASQSCWETRVSPWAKDAQPSLKRSRLDSERKAVLFESVCFLIRLGCSLEHWKYPRSFEVLGNWKVQRTWKR